MLKKSITYTNPFTEEEVTEEHYFHVSKADLVEMELVEHGTKYTSKTGEELTGMQAKLQQIVDSEDGKAILRELKDMIRRSYGKKEGDRFVRSSEIWEEFASSEAYSQLIFDLCTDAEKSAEFIAGILPSGLEAAQIREAALAETNGDTPVHVGDGEVKTDDPITMRQRVIQEATPENPVTLTEVEMKSISHIQLKEGLASGALKLQ